MQNKKMRKEKEKMEGRSAMSERDRELWNKLTEWAVCRVAAYLNLMEAGQEEDQKQNEGDHENLLSFEVHDFFQMGLEILPLPDISAGEGLFKLWQRLKLDRFELFCVILAMLSELDYHFEKLFVYLNNDWNQRLLSVEWAVNLYTMGREPEVFCLSYFLPEGRLAKQVFDIRSEGACSGLRKGLKLKTHILEFLLCSGRFSSKPYLEWNPDTEDFLSAWLEDKVCSCLESAEWIRTRHRKTVVFHLWGNGKREPFLYPVWYAQKRGQPLGVMDYRKMQKSLEDDWQKALTALEEVALAEGILCIHNAEYVQKDEEKSWSFTWFLQCAAEKVKILFLISSERAKGWRIPGNVDYVPVEIPLPEGSRRQQLWEKMAEEYPVSKETLSQSAVFYDFGLQEMEQSLQDAWRIACAREDQEMSAADLHEACRRQIQHNLKEWAVLVENHYGWEDLILPKEQKEILTEGVNQILYRQQVYEEWGFSRIRSYGTGMNLLFTGPPGTGKTMAAQVIAGELGMELYKIQLPLVVSKYIGETEQNLRRIFQEGRKSRVVLFFDEADVLFGKRTEVKDSHDKYSNMEAAYMLQNMEEYTGVVILATNFPQNIDSAFKRRITIRLEFYLPDYENRLLLWRKSVPKQLPLEPDVDFEDLARRFELSGSNIKNVMLHAAFLAAPNKEAVGKRHILRALKREMEKSGQYYSEKEFLPDFM